ncbi:MAG: redoxin domain-containing protein [Candidatus Marinimicrobia bacterium]|nr:redoxin domain-containing protein [Candidatus Neomarinimicrobiota bacterium]
MFKLSRSYFLSILLTAFMATCVCAQDQVSEIKETPGIGDTFPHFQLTDTEYQSVDLYDYFQSQPVLLIYYRGGW